LIVENLLEILGIILPIISIIFTVIVKVKAEKELEILKLEIQRNNTRKERLSERQRMVLFILQNITSNMVKVKNNDDIEEKIRQILNTKNNKEMFQVDIFNSPIYAFTNEISLSTCSERVMAIRLLIQEESYNQFSEYS